MNYWNETMQDDVYVIAGDGWKEGGIVYRKQKETKDKNGKTKTKEIEGLEGIESKLIQPDLIVNKYFLGEKDTIENLQAECETIASQLTEIKEENSGEEGLMEDLKNDKDKITLSAVKDRLKKIKNNPEDKEEEELLERYLELSDKKSTTEKKIKELQKQLEQKVWDQYKLLSEEEIKEIVVNDKWILTLEVSIRTELNRVSQRLAERIKELAERYETTLTEIDHEVELLEEKVKAHLHKMDFVWN
jgi:type I restriction enzyme M protein